MRTLNHTDTEFKVKNLFKLVSYVPPTHFAARLYRDWRILSNKISKNDPMWAVFLQFYSSNNGFMISMMQIYRRGYVACKVKRQPSKYWCFNDACTVDRFVRKEMRKKTTQININFFYKFMRNCHCRHADSFSCITWTADGIRLPALLFSRYVREIH
jgi:hypothetical protein